METISPNQIKDKPKKIGKLKDKIVYSLETKGGLAMILAQSEGGKDSKLLGTGSHMGIAMHIAREDYPELQVTQLAKSEFVPREWVEQYLPKYRLITTAMASRLGW